MNAPKSPNSTRLAASYYVAFGRIALYIYCVPNAPVQNFIFSSLSHIQHAQHTVYVISDAVYSAV